MPPSACAPPCALRTIPRPRLRHREKGKRPLIASREAQRGATISEVGWIWIWIWAQSPPPRVGSQRQRGRSGRRLQCGPCMIRARWILGYQVVEVVGSSLVSEDLATETDCGLARIQTLSFWAWVASPTVQVNQGPGPGSVLPGALRATRPLLILCWRRGLWTPRWWQGHRTWACAKNGISVSPTFLGYLPRCTDAEGGPPARGRHMSFAEYNSAAGQGPCCLH